MQFQSISQTNVMEKQGDHLQSRACYGNGILKGRKVKRKLNDIVFIDIDGDRFDNAIVIDDNESGSKSSHSNLGQQKKSSCVICVDDDDNDVFRQTSAPDGGDLDSDASSSRRSFPTSSFKPHMVDVDEDDDDDGRPARHERKFPFKFSRCKQKSYGKVPARNRFGVSFNIYTGSSESDCSDCEVIDGSSEKLQEQWKRASQKRKTSVHVDTHRADDQASTSSLPSDIKLNANAEKSTKQHTRSPIYCNENNVDHAGENRTADDSAFTTLNPRSESAFMESHKTSKQENLYFMKDGIGGEPRSNDELPDERMCSGDPLPNNNNGSCEKVHGDVTGCDDKEFSSERHHSLRSNIERCEAESLHGEACREVKVAEDGLLDKSKANSVLISHHEEERSDSMELTFGMEAKGLCDGKNVVQISDVPPCVETSIINGREILKASDEYKAAVEEEWASRHRELQIQAEESQRLRKRKKAESLRLLDMQKRQKERLEEVRETQKKDEENMNLKEKIRAEIIKELNKLEVSENMASLLRGLGIEVGHGLVPLSGEVHAAYKRALFKFHPDRASRMDIREQVAAEEKFKLIARMKDKLEQQ